MSTTPLTLRLLAESYAVCRLAPNADVAAWGLGGVFSSVTRTAEELSVVCAEALVPEGVQRETGWRCLRVAGTLDFALVGVLAALAVPLAECGVSIFVVSTFDTDYLLVRDKDLESAIHALAARGHTVHTTS